MAEDSPENEFLKIRIPFPYRLTSPTVYKKGAVSGTLRLCFYRVI